MIYEEYFKRVRKAIFEKQCRITIDANNKAQNTTDENNCTRTGDEKTKTQTCKNAEKKKGLYILACLRI